MPQDPRGSELLRGEAHPCSLAVGEVSSAWLTDPCSARFGSSQVIEALWHKLREPTA
jgi:hypothetical protein